ncbi:transketolase [Streptomyces glaucescens]|jgi:hypothetical protein
MDPIVLAAGTALVGAMASDAWQQTRISVVSWWRRVRSAQEAEGVGQELVEVRTEVLAAREAGDTDTERALAGTWQVRLQQMLREDPALEHELRRLLEGELTPVLPADEEARIKSLLMKATASGHGRVYQAGRDQHISDR